MGWVAFISILWALQEQHSLFDSVIKIHMTSTSEKLLKSKDIVGLYNVK